MSHNPGDAATTAREQETEQTQTPSAEQNAQGAQPATADQQTGNAPPASADRQAEMAHATGAHHQAEHAHATGTDNQAQAGQTSEVNSQAQDEPSSETLPPEQRAIWPATPQPTGDQDEGVASSANVDATTPAQDTSKEQFEPRPDMSDQDYKELLPKLLALFNNNREQLGRALGLHRSTVDRWLNGKSRPNTSTILRMRRLAQERNIE
jgi:Helix-turn-helix